MALAGKRIAILTKGGFVDSEITEPMWVMRDVCAQVVVVGIGSKNTYR